MIDAMPSITLREWETLDPATCPQLKWSSLKDWEPLPTDLERINKSQQLRLVSLREGLQVSARSFVGRVRLGNLQVTIIPKLRTRSLLRLLQYAYDCRKLNLFSDSEQLIEECGFADLLIQQLLAEAQELIARGLHKTYVRRAEQLTSPRGRIDIERLALAGGTATATLPCQHFPRIEDTPLNRVLLAGLRLASTIADHLPLRRQAQKLASLLDEQVTRIRLDASALDKANQQLSRLTSAYGPSLTIIRMLLEAQGVVLDDRAGVTRLSGFMFDMNQFFQALLSKFLREHLVGYTVRDEHSLVGMLRYQRGFNPRAAKAPSPRPDFAIFQGSRLQVLLDAKYRDLWAKDLPREMLYQLVVYAISHRARPQSVILYPTTDPLAREARIEVQDPIHGQHLAEVCLRPVSLDRIDELVGEGTQQEKEDLAANLVGTPLSFAGHGKGRQRPIVNGR